jgi:hypothetical protein
VYATGQFNLLGPAGITADFDPGPGEYNLTSAGNADVFLARLLQTGDPPPATISGRVWHDVDGDGVQDAGEPGLLGTYYNDSSAAPNDKFIAEVLTRVDPNVNFNWSSASPAPGQVNNDYFSVRWAGSITPEFSETYTFRTTTSDGVRLCIGGTISPPRTGIGGTPTCAGGTMVVDNFTVHSLAINQGTIPLVAGRQYPIEIEYFEQTVAATMRLEWSSPSQPLQIVPSSRISTSPGEPAIEGVTVYLDLDDDGTLDEDDPGTPGVDEAEPQTVTDAGGQYWFSVAAGTYRVRQIIPSGYMQIYPGAVDNYSHLVSIAAGEVAEGHDFGNQVREEAEIEVRGGGVLIANGDSTPDVADGTDFGTVLQGDPPVERTFTVTNVRGGGPGAGAGERAGGVFACRAARAAACSPGVRYVHGAARHDDRRHLHRRSDVRHQRRGRKPVPFQHHGHSGRSAAGVDLRPGVARRGRRRRGGRERAGPRRLDGLYRRGRRRAAWSRRTEHDDLGRRSRHERRR